MPGKGKVLEMPDVKILVVEDENHIRRSIMHILKKNDFDPVEARDGEEALQKIHEDRPEVVLLDIMMPGRNGYDVCRIVKRDPVLRDTYIILLTAKGQTADWEKGIEAGADDYITKPFSARDILDRVEWLANNPG